MYDNQSEATINLIAVRFWKSNRATTFRDLRDFRNFFPKYVEIFMVLHIVLNIGRQNFTYRI